MEDKFCLDIKVFPCVFTSVFVIFAFVDFGGWVERGYYITSPSPLFQIVYAMLFRGESVLQVF